MCGTTTIFCIVCDDDFFTYYSCLYNGHLLKCPNCQTEFLVKISRVVPKTQLDEFIGDFLANARNFDNLGAVQGILWRDYKSFFGYEPEDIDILLLEVMAKARKRYKIQIRPSVDTEFRDYHNKDEVYGYLGAMEKLKYLRHYRNGESVYRAVEVVSSSTPSPNKRAK